MPEGSQGTAHCCGPQSTMLNRNPTYWHSAQSRWLCWVFGSCLASGGVELNWLNCLITLAKNLVNLVKQPYSQVKKMKLVFHLDFDHKVFQERSFLSPPCKPFVQYASFPWLLKVSYFLSQPQWWMAAGCHSLLYTFLSTETWSFRVISISKGDWFTLEWEVERIIVKLFVFVYALLQL